MSRRPEPSRARRWLGEAFEELEAARHIVDDAQLVPRLACFLAHLAAEKAFKAGLIAGEVPFRKTHDLVELYRMLPFRDAVDLREEDLKLLNPWTIDGRIRTI